MNRPKCWLILFRCQEQVHSIGFGAEMYAVKFFSS